MGLRDAVLELYTSSKMTITEGDSHPLKLLIVESFKHRLSVVNSCFLVRPNDS